MKNDQYKPGSLRVIVDSRGKQFLAFEDGVKIPYQIETTIYQDTLMSNKGVCRVNCKMHVNAEGCIDLGDNAAEWANGVLKVGEREALVDQLKVTLPQKGEEFAAFAEIECIAYPDVTPQDT